MSYNFEKNVFSQNIKKQSMSGSSVCSAHPSFSRSDYDINGRDVELSYRTITGDLNVENARVDLYNSTVYGDIISSYGNIDIQRSNITGRVKNDNSKGMYYESRDLVHEFFALEKRLNTVIKNSHIGGGLSNKNGAVYLQNTVIDGASEIKNGYLVLKGNNQLDKLSIPADELKLEGKNVIRRLFTVADGPLYIPKDAELISNIEFDRRGEGRVIVEEGGRFTGNIINGRLIKE